MNREGDLNRTNCSPETTEHSGFKIWERYVDVLDLTDKSHVDKLRCDNKDIQKCTATPQVDGNNTEAVISQQLTGKALFHKRREIPNNNLTNNAPKTREEINKLIIRRIFDLDAKLKKDKPKRNENKRKVDNAAGKIANPKRILKKIESIDKKLKKSSGGNAVTNKKRSAKLTTMATQTCTGAGDYEPGGSQTNAKKSMKEANVQMESKCDTKHIQTINDTNNTATSALLDNTCAKFTNTDLNYPLKTETAQFVEHMSNSDLFCLEWVNKHLFDVNLSSYTIVVDDKIREISEVVTKTSFLTDFESNRELLALDYI